MPVYEVLGQLHEAPGVGSAASLPVRQVNDVAAQGYRLDHGPGQRRAGLHATQAGVPDLETDNVGAGSHAADDVVARVAALDLLVVGAGGGGGVVPCSDAGHVRPVRTGIDDDAQDGAIIVDVDGIVQHAHVAHGLVLPLFGEVRHGFQLSQIAALGHVDDGPVVRPVEKQNTVDERTGIRNVQLFGFIRSRFQLQHLQQRRQVVPHADVLETGLGRVGVGGVPLGQAGPHVGRVFGLGGVVRDGPVGLDATEEGSREQLVRALDAQPDRDGLGRRVRLGIGIATNAVVLLERFGERANLPIAAKPESPAGQPLLHLPVSSSSSLRIFLGRLHPPGRHLGGHVDVAAASAVHDVGQVGHARRPGIDARVQNADRHVAAVVRRVLGQESRGVGLRLGNEGLGREGLHDN